MTRAVVHRTPGDLDLRSFNTFGLHAKPGTISPIGIFGTGLKYAIAVLVREGVTFYIMSGGYVYSFYKKLENFRGETVEMIHMKRENRCVVPLESKFSDLPFTTALGRNWKLWQVFRELHSNTIDENGETYCCDLDDLKVGENETVIAVVDERYAEMFDASDEIFLPNGLRETTLSSGRIQVLEGPSQYIYYRGVRVVDLEKPSRMTYNFLSDVELTEDRTAKYPSLMESAIRRLIATTDDETLAVAAATADPNSFEGGLNYDYDYTSPSDTFTQAVRSAALPAQGAQRLIASTEPRRRLRNPLEGTRRPLRLVRGGEIVDQDDVTVGDLDPGYFTESQMRYVVQLMNQDLDPSDFEEYLEGEDIYEEEEQETADVRF